MSTLNRSQRLVIVVGLGAALYVLGQWMMSLGSHLTGWVGYAPLSNQFPFQGLHPWLRLAIWLVLIALWVLSSAALLGSDNPREHDQD